MRLALHSALRQPLAAAQRQTRRILSSVTTDQAAETAKHGPVNIGSDHIVKGEAGKPKTFTELIPDDLRNVVEQRYEKHTLRSIFNAVDAPGFTAGMRQKVLKVMLERARS